MKLFLLFKYETEIEIDSPLGVSDRLGGDRKEKNFLENSNAIRKKRR
jgi:hypothetical protein